MTEETVDWVLLTTDGGGVSLAELSFGTRSADASNRRRICGAPGKVRDEIRT